MWQEIIRARHSTEYTNALKDYYISLNGHVACEERCEPAGLRLGATASDNPENISQLACWCRLSGGMAGVECKTYTRNHRLGGCVLCRFYGGRECRPPGGQQRLGEGDVVSAQQAIRHHVGYTPCSRQEEEEEEEAAAATKGGGGGGGGSKRRRRRRGRNTNTFNRRLSNAPSTSRMARPARVSSRSNHVCQRPPPYVSTPTCM